MTYDGLSALWTKAAQQLAVAMASTLPTRPSPCNTFMRAALLEAQCALDEDEVPVGCVMVHNGSVVGRRC